MTRQPVFRREFLRGLSQEDTQHFIEATAGVEPHHGLVDTIFAHTEGNPFFMIEVVRLLSERGELTADRSSATQGELIEHISIPQGVREVIGQRLNRLSGECSGVLSTAAVIGRVFSLEHMNRLVDDLSEDRLLEVLEEGLEALVIEELPGKAGSYQFTQHLIQETLLTELSTTRRGRLHGRIAEMLEGLYGSAAEDHASELAYHYAGALTATGTEKLAHYSRLAGEQALAIYAHEEALAHFERALTAKEKQPTDAETAAVWFGLGHAQGATGQVYDAWSSLRLAFDYYFEAGDVAKAVAVAEYPLLYVTGLEQATEMVERALTLVSPESLEAGYLLSRYGLLVNLETGDYDRAQEAFARALVIAQLEKDPVLEMRARGAAADVDTYHLRWPAVLENSLRAIELAARVGDPLAEVWPRYSATTALLVLGDPQEAAFHAEAMLGLAEEVRNRDLLANALYVNSNLAYLKGDWQTSRKLNDRALDLVPQLFILLQHRSLLEYQVGEFGQGQGYMERLLELMRETSPGPTGEYISVAWLIPIVGYITGVTNRFEIAEAAAETVLSSPSATPLAKTFTKLGLAVIAALKGDPVSSEEYYVDLESGKGEMWDGVYGAGDRILGLLARTIGRLDQAVDHFEDSMAFCRKAGYQPELAWTSCDYADALLQRNEPGDRKKALALLDESLAISSDLGMRPLMERVLSRRDILIA